MDPIDGISTSATCKGNSSAANIEWIPPTVLVGVDIISYNISLDGVCYNVNGSENDLVVCLPALSSSSCEVRNVCAAAATLAGWSNWSCTETIILEG